MVEKQEPEQEEQEEQEELVGMLAPRVGKRPGYLVGSSRAAAPLPPLISFPARVGDIKIGGV